MTVLKCDSCGAKVEAPKCCGKHMKVKGTEMKCDCGDEECEHPKIEVNHCCGKPMVEDKKENATCRCCKH
ncbi:MAG: hypothetical protein ABIA76_02335 [Candidatus Diapherotrites archaeon]